MAIYTRVEWDNFPGAITICELPWFCVQYSTIQGLGGALMSVPQSAPSTIIGGIIYTQLAKTIVEQTVCQNPPP